MNNFHTTDPMRDHVMDAIKKGEARMKPRWHFVLISVSFTLAVFVTVIILLYAVSLSVFLLRESGVWYVLGFGMQGWFAFLRSIPIAHVVFVLLFVVVLEFLMCRYAFVYQRPLVGSFLVITGFVTLGGVLIAQTPLHHEAVSYVRTHQLPTPLDLSYGFIAHMDLPPDIIEGVVVAEDNVSLTIEYDDRDNHDRKEQEYQVEGRVDQQDDHSQDVATSTAQKQFEEKKKQKETEELSEKTEKKEINSDVSEQSEKYEHEKKRGKKKSRVVITPQTKLPHGKTFKVGKTVIVQGNRVATDTIEAFGVRGIED